MDYDNSDPIKCKFFILTQLIFEKKKVMTPKQVHHIHLAYLRL